MERYNILIYEKFKELLNSGKTEFNNNDLWKIFEYYCCVMLSKEYDTIFYEYNDIDPTFKEINFMTRNDTGIDLCNLNDTIVQCKLRKKSLCLKECATFFASQVIYNKELKKPSIRWDNLIIARNDSCSLSDNLLEKKHFQLFTDKTFNKQELLNYCDNLIKNPPKYPEINNDFKLRDYQLECIDIINKNKNVIINLPTGTGKNSVIIYSLKGKCLILVPRIILMDQLKEEIIKHKPKYENNIQLIGDSKNKFDKDKLITICIYNSVHIIKDNTFDRIYIDEAHHINRPEIYYDMDEEPDKETNKYIDIIKGFTKYNNNVYLSATIDEFENFLYYKKDIRKMIELKYLCDYNITVPIFTNDPSNKNICRYLINNYSNIIIYCNSQKEGRNINNLMNKILNNSSEYIDCDTPKKERELIIKKYKTGNISFLVNVRVLVEGFDAPITKGVCFLHLPCNNTTIIQIIGRCLRLHPMKTIANVILPCSNEFDDKGINSFLKVMAFNDSRIRKSYEEKKLGGYINIDNIDIDDDEYLELKYNMIYNSLGQLLNGHDIWLKRLEDVKKYINDNKKKPSTTDTIYNVKQLGYWIHNQNTFYANEDYIMKDKDIKEIWENFIKEYQEYFLSNEEIWKIKLQQLKLYIDTHKKFPSRKNTDNVVKQMAEWFSCQRQKYKNKETIMKKENIRKLYEEFIKEYKQYQKVNIKTHIYISLSWKEKLQKTKEYIDKYKKLPSKADDNFETRQLGNFLSIQKRYYKEDKIIARKEYEEFLEEYKCYFSKNQNNDEIWKTNLIQVEEYINKYNKKPTHSDKLGFWLSRQQQNYKNIDRTMKNETIRKLYENFITKYKKYFVNNEELLKLIDN